ncbi:MAG: hypothetical protein NTW15_14550 [Burkholderiales bacterium]|nr:hypothetical protein [Burkholderiales bacterium]
MSRSSSVLLRAARIAALLGAACLAVPASAQAPKPPAAAAAPAPATAAPVDVHRRDDIAKHRAIAVAHDAAARCLESGRPEGECQQALRRACEGIAVGRYCGMKHSH